MSRRERRYRREQLVAQARQRGILFTNTSRENGGVQQAEQYCDPPEAEYERQHGDFADHDQIIGVPNEAIGPAVDKRRIGQNDDARRPPFSKRGDYPDPRELEQDVKREPKTVDGPFRPKPPQYGQPQDMNRHDEGIMTGTHFMGAPGKEAPGVAARQPQF